MLKEHVEAKQREVNSNEMPSQILCRDQVDEHQDEMKVQKQGEEFTMRMRSYGTKSPETHSAFTVASFGRIT